MKLKKIAILTNTRINIDYVVNSIKQKNHIDDIVILSDADNTIGIKNYAILPSFYLKFFDGSVVFTDINDYMIYKDEVVSREMFLLSNLEELLQANIDRSMLAKYHTTLIAKENSV